MKIKIKYIVKWFILLFPLILTFIYLIKNNFNVVNEEMEFFSYLINFSEVNPISNALSRIVCIFLPSEYGDIVTSENNLEIMILSSFTWFIQMWFFWEFCELVSHFYHKITNQEEE